MHEKALPFIQGFIHSFYCHVDIIRWIIEDVLDNSHIHSELSVSRIEIVYTVSRKTIDIDGTENPLKRNELEFKLRFKYSLHVTE